MDPRTVERQERTPFEEGLSLLPYARVNLRMHRRRIGWGVLAAIAAAGLGWLAARPTPVRSRRPRAGRRFQNR